MSDMELFEAVGEIDESLIARCAGEAAGAPKRMRTWRLLVAACLCAALLCAAVLPVYRKTANPPRGGNTPHVSANTDNEAKGNSASIYINRLDKEPQTRNGMIALMTDDLIPMTDGEFLKYYGISLNISGAAPALKMQPQDPAQSSGIYENSSRGVYYDSHTFTFLHDDGAGRLEIMLSKKALYPFFMVEQDNGGIGPEQSEIDGFAVTVFGYTDGDGSACFHTEFLLGGAAYCITSYNLSEKDYTAALTALISGNMDDKAGSYGTADTHTVTGTVDAADENADLISISCGGGVFSALKIYLPRGGAKKYSPGDKVRVSYTGNPATIGTIWRGQLKSIVPASD